MVSILQASENKGRDRQSIYKGQSKNDMSKNINIIKSESFSNRTALKDQDQLLNECIADFVEELDTIINIQLVESNGLFRFWVYSQSNVSRPNIKSIQSYYDNPRI